MHAHCNLDPKDYGFCEYSPKQLIDRSSELGYDILSITCHDADIWTDDLCSYARSLGIILIPGMEVTAEKTRHVLVYNFDKGAESLNTLEKIRRHRSSDTLVVAPHPFFPGHSCLRRKLLKNIEMFDAIEYSGFVVPGFNFNRLGTETAQKHGKTLLGFGDVHHLWQLGKTYTWVYAEPDAFSILAALRNGQVRLETSPISWAAAASWGMDRLWRAVFPANSPPDDVLDKIEDRRRLGAA